ncbi:MAG TPA: spore cortex biosynthesis protein YabQ [Bacillota bacterium]|nr:spore cortex biosynthesis protein YabQ [Bacillota bacterium]
MEALSGQLSSFVMVMVTGAAWGAFYDIYHSRSSCGARRKRSDPRDLLFWLLSAILIAVGLILTNWLELRLFIAIGFVLGYITYAFLGRPIIGPLLRGINLTINRILFPLANLKNRLLLGGRARRALKVGGKQSK